MNVRLNVGAVLKTWQGVGTIAWCTLWLGMAGTMLMPSRATAADSTAATRTTLTVTTSQPHQRTQATLTAHVSAANEEATPTGVVTFRSETTDLGSAFLDREGNAALQTDNLTAGSHQIVAVYQGEKAFVTSTSDAEKLHAQCSCGCRLYPCGHAHLALDSGGRLCKHHRDRHPQQRLQCVCQPVVQGTAFRYHLHLYSAECSSTLHYQRQRC